MILVVTGSRYFQNRIRVTRMLNKIKKQSELVDPTTKMTVIMGDCPTGADKIALDWAIGQVGDVRYDVFKAQWDLYGKMAGPARNRNMVLFAKRLSEQSPTIPIYCVGFLKKGAKNAGTLNCLKEAENVGIQTAKYWGE